jgi:hypothetical protein
MLMQESSGRKTETGEPDSDATSKETLEDIEDNEKSSAVNDGGRELDVPSPDGALDESGEAKDDGPM